MTAQKNEKPVCKTCNGERMVGGWSGGAASIDGGGSYENHPCPDCVLPTYEQLSALCAQMAAALKETVGAVVLLEETKGQNAPFLLSANAALTAHRTLSPDPQWQRVPEGCVVVPVDLLGEAVGTLQALDAQTPTKACQSTIVKIYELVERARGEG